MKYLSLVIGAFFLVALPARANSVAYAHCGTYDSYILLYKSTQKFEELGKLRCGEQVEVVAANDDYTEVRTEDGRVGWVMNGDTFRQRARSARRLHFWIDREAQG